MRWNKIPSVITGILFNIWVLNFLNWNFKVWTPAQAIMKAKAQAIDAAPTSARLSSTLKNTMIIWWSSTLYRPLNLVCFCVARTRNVQESSTAKTMDVFIKPVRIIVEMQARYYRNGAKSRYQGMIEATKKSKILKDFSKKSSSYLKIRMVT